MPAVGIPIGNLTSQIFANIYLNDLDFYVRHTLKPLAYLRYGDDFVMFFESYTDAKTTQSRCRKWLSDNLCLSVNPKNNVVVKISSGLYYLGHRIHRNSLVVEKVMDSKVLVIVNEQNISSYQAIRLTSKTKKILSWQVIRAELLNLF
ncbi:RNA-directed DNA polymerase [Candidatus Saccharibacteria bacterium]|jgi:hypothetical protein|nr:RNA-directed DNA polymerase [Candidatus Saccharibacteria bacterium]MCA9341738.1 RNA-directed DNA polymerase [Candidatus Saccharibacteria bacterium]